MDVIGYALASKALSTAETAPTFASAAIPAVAPRSHGQGAYGEINGILYTWYGQRIDAYDPVADTWTNKTTVANNLGDCYSFGVINNRLIVAHDSAGSTYNKRWGFYNPDTNTWALADTNPGPSLRERPAGAVSSLGLHVAGGKDNSATYITGHGVLSDYGGVWTAKAALPKGIWVPVGAAATADKFYVINPLDPAASFAISQDILVYDVATNTWTTESNIFGLETTSGSPPGLQGWIGADGSLFCAMADQRRIVYQRSPGATEFKAFTLPAGLDIYYFFGTPNIGIAIYYTTPRTTWKFTPFKSLRNHPLLAHLAAKQQ